MIMVTMFFLALTFAALTSMISTIEMCVRNFVDHGFSRDKAVGATAIAIFILGIPSAIIAIKVDSASGVMYPEFLEVQDLIWGYGLMFSGLFIAFTIWKYGWKIWKEKVAAGEADYAVANTYYIALMLSGKKGPEQQAAAKKVKPFFPNQDGRGTHMNISGGGVLKHAPNKANAIKLLEFLLTKEAQQHIVNNTFEYPMIEGVEPNKLIAQFGLGFKQDLKTKVSKYGKNQADALKIMTEAGWE